VVAQALPQLVGPVLANVERILAVGREPIGRGDECQAVRPQQSSDRFQVGGRVRQVLDDLKADDEIERGSSQRRQGERPRRGEPGRFRL
jgi:hypothetical protein